MVMTPEGRRVISAWEGRTLQLWDLETGQTIRRLENHLVTAVVMMPDGRRVISALDDQTLRLWDLESGKEIATFSGESDMRSCAIAPDGRRIVAGDRSGRVHFLRLVEADRTKPPIGDTKIRLLHRKEHAS
jgi:WD40 repeat protein